MPVRTPAGSDYTKVVGASAQVNASVGNASSGIAPKRTSGSVPLAGGLLSAARSSVTQSRVSQTSGLQPFAARVSTTPAAPPRKASIALTTATGNSGVLAKYSSSGEVLNAITTCAGTCWVTTDSNGNIYVLGPRSATVASNLDGTLSNITPTNAGFSIIKYSPTGVVQWTVGVTMIAGAAIHCDSSGNVIVLGLYQNYAGYKDSALNGNLTPNFLGGSGFVMYKFTSAGLFVWRIYTRAMSESGLESFGGITTDSTGAVYLCRYIDNTADNPLTFTNADDSSFGTTISVSGQTMFLVIKYNSSGTIQWIVHLSQVDYSFGLGIALDSSNNIYACGAVRGTSTIYKNNVSTGVTVTGIGNRVGMLMKLSNAGDPQWAVPFEAGGTYQYAKSVVCDTSGNIYVTGVYRVGGDNIITFKGTDATTKVITSNNTNLYYNSYVVKYNPSGIPQWAARIGTPSTGSPVGDIYTFGIDIDRTSGDLYVVGNYATSSLVVYDINAGAFTITPTGSSAQVEAFLVKYSSLGVPVWITTLKGTDYETFSEVKVYNNNIYVSGRTVSTTSTIFSSA